MYELSKRIVQNVFPQKILDKHKRKLRYFIGLGYRGMSYKCNMCEADLRKFISLKSGDLLCPNCGSLPRTRGLWQVVKGKLDHKIVLHFSPSPSLKNLIEKQSNVKAYITSDFKDEFESECKLDIEDINLKDKSVDLIICYHILEHVENDRRALNEMYRVLHDNGSCFIQTPFKDGAIYENANVKTPDERLKYFGQKDHVRIYSPLGLENRMRSSGFSIEKMETRNESNNYHGFKNKDIILIGKKDTE